MRSGMSLGIGVLLALLASGSGPFVAEAANGSLELVGTIGPTEGVRPWYVEIVRGLESDSDQLLLSVMNRGARCRGFLWVGTDADATGNAHLYRLSLMLEVAIDIRPGSRRNPINPLSRGVIPVALLTTGAGAREDFDAWDVDPLTILFGPAGAPIVHAQGHAMDVDGDGDLDRILHFRTQQTGIRCGDTEATLTGTTFDGQAIQGVDAIRTVNCRARSNRGAARGPRGVHRKGKPGPRVEN